MSVQAYISYMQKDATDCLASPADGGIEYPINRMDLSGREDNDVKTVPELKPVLKPKKKPTLNTATGSFATNNN